MIGALFRKEPRIDHSELLLEPTISRGEPVILRDVQTAPTGALTRSIRREQASPILDDMRESLGIGEETFDAITTELLAAGAPLQSERAVVSMVDALFDFEPLGAQSRHPFILAGASREVRMRAALALSQKLDRAGRRIALYTLDQGDADGEETAVAFLRGGMDILQLSTVEACIDAVRATEPMELAIVDVPCLSPDSHDLAALATLRSEIGGEIVYIHDCADAAVPEGTDEAGIHRMILCGQSAPDTVGPMLDIAYSHRWGIAGHVSDRGVYYVATPRMVADTMMQALG